MANATKTLAICVFELKIASAIDFFVNLCYNRIMGLSQVPYQFGHISVVYRADHLEFRRWMRA